MRLFYLLLRSFCLQFVYVTYDEGTIGKKDQIQFPDGGTVSKKDQTKFQL